MFSKEFWLVAGGIAIGWFMAKRHAEVGRLRSELEAAKRSGGVS